MKLYLESYQEHILGFIFKTSMEVEKGTIQKISAVTFKYIIILEEPIIYEHKMTFQTQNGTKIMNTC